MSTVTSQTQLYLITVAGILVTGANAAIAFDDAYYLERACMFQSK